MQPSREADDDDDDYDEDDIEIDDEEESWVIFWSFFLPERPNRSQYILMSVITQADFQKIWSFMIIFSTCYPVLLFF